ncbi:DUF3596 domain-containing protein [Aquisalimonas lutea]|uniref:Arm DNA-binding domain-containing protein n=1 Tax=Aquisalimonas lutea TaxID=1327750 RepID=UPI0025B3F463|nr:DUF3596 domain-containing protein [Aquisalimonas lutea]MDN3519780.1 DUF3596 domain-containing protein [Aquisalimonas lutea]
MSQSTPRGITITPNDTIQIAFTWHGRHYRERLPLPPNRANLRYAAQKRAAILYEIEHGRFDFREHFPNSPRARQLSHNATPRVREALRVYLADVTHHCAPSTARDYACVVHTHLLPAFGDLQLHEVTVARLRAWMRSWPHGTKRLGTVLTPLRRALGDAYADGLIDRDPLDRIRIPVERHRAPPQPDPLTPEELQRVLAACERRSFARLVRFAVSTGLRTSELLGLEWSDINWSRGSVRINRVIVRGRAKPVTKTLAGQHEIELLPVAREALVAEYRAQVRIGGRIWRDPATGLPYASDAAIRRHWRHTLRAASVRYRPPYQLRHTYASWLLTAGEDPSWIAMQMGHADWAMIRRVYARWIPQIHQSAGERGAQLFVEALSNNTYFARGYATGNRILASGTMPGRQARAQS